MPYVRAHTLPQWPVQGSEAGSGQSQKQTSSSVCRLQLACMKAGSLVIADQHAAVVVRALAHARHTTASSARSRCPNQGGARRRWEVVRLKS